MNDPIEMLMADHREIVRLVDELRGSVPGFRRIREALGRLDDLVDAPGFASAVEMLGAGLRHHLDEEENELFPSLSDQAGRAEWVAVGDAIADARQRRGQPLAVRCGNETEPPKANAFSPSR